LLLPSFARLICQQQRKLRAVQAIRYSILLLALAGGLLFAQSTSFGARVDGPDLAHDEIFGKCTEDPTAENHNELHEEHKRLEQATYSIKACIQKGLQRTSLPIVLREPLAITSGLQTPASVFALRILLMFDTTKPGVTACTSMPSFLYSWARAIEK